MVNSMSTRWKKFNINPIKYCFNEWVYMMKKAGIEDNILELIAIFVIGLFFMLFVSFYEIIFYLFNKQN